MEKACIEAVIRQVGRKWRFDNSRLAAITAGRAHPWDRSVIVADLIADKKKHICGVAVDQIYTNLQKRL